MEIKNVEIFKPGKWNGSDFTSVDLDHIAQSFHELRLTGNLPVKIGHTMDDTEPAQGWITDVRRSGDTLLADLDDVPDAVAEEIKAGRWRFVSVELLRNVARGDKKYPLVLDGLALLGAARPAVEGLKPLNELFNSHHRDGWVVGSRVCFSLEVGGNESMSDIEALKRQNEMLTRELIAEKFNAAITSGRCLARDRQAFEMRYGSSATLNDAVNWIASSPMPTKSNNRIATVAGASIHQQADGMPDSNASIDDVVCFHREKFLADNKLDPRVTQNQQNALVFALKKVGKAAARKYHLGYQFERYLDHAEG